MDSYMERKGGFVFENPNAAKTLQQSSEIRERSSIICSFFSRSRLLS